MHPNIMGVRKLAGNSESTLAQKYGLTLYMLLFTSLRKTGLSSGKIKMIFWIELKEIVIVIKNKAPFLFCTP